MRRLAPLFAVTLILLCGLAVAEEATTTTLTGEYHWTQRDKKGELEAVFTPTGESTFDVQFHFNFRGKDHAYTGTAEGSLREGALSGTVKNESKERTFNFEGSVADGVFTGTHSETGEAGDFDTGTLTLK
jgi:hypothetical protein